MSALVRAAVMVGVFVSVASWSGRAAAQGPTAAFTFTVTGDTVFLTDTSTGPAAITSWTWMFGDGGGSIAQNPIHDYCTSIGQCSSGPHTVTLTVSDGNGRSDTVSMLITLETPGASYTTDISGLTVVFTDTSTPGASAITLSAQMVTPPAAMSSIDTRPAPISINFLPMDPEVRRRRSRARVDIEANRES